MMRYFWWIGLCLNVHNITTCKLCAQFLPNKILTKPMHLDIPNVPFTGCAVESIGILPTTTKGHKFTLTFVCLLTSYVIVVPLKQRQQKKLWWCTRKKYYKNYCGTCTFYMKWYWKKWSLNFDLQEPWNKKKLQQSLLSKRKWKNKKCTQFSEKDNSQIFAQEYTW